MASWTTVISTSALNQNFLRAEYYAPKYRALDTTLESTGQTAKLADLCNSKLFQGWSPKGGVKGQVGIPAVKVQNLTGYGLNWEMDRVDISPNRVPRRAWAKEGDIFVIRCAHHPRYIGLSIDSYIPQSGFDHAFITEKIIVASSLSEKKCDVPFLVLLACLPGALDRGSFLAPPFIKGVGGIFIR